MRVLVALAIASACLAQTEFEVASVKPDHSLSQGSNFNRTPGGGLNATNVTLREMIIFAYDIRDHQLTGGPGWMDSDRYDVVAKASHDDVVETNNFEEAFRLIRLKMRALLANRFKLAIHTETREMPIYALVIARNGPHLEQSKSDGLTMHRQNGHLICKGASMKAFAERDLALRMGRNVVDKTGLAGEFDFEVKYAEDRGAASTDASGPDFLTAMQEQLGLKLEPQKGPVEVIVVDSAEKASAN
jgi:uncharacterized protein (TIGR03435 family)